MREDIQDQIDKLFPKGYLIIYTLPDGQIRYNKYNPLKLTAIAYWEYLLLKTNKEQGALEHGGPAHWDSEGAQMEGPDDPEEFRKAFGDMMEDKEREKPQGD